MKQKVEEMIENLVPLSAVVISNEKMGHTAVWAIPQFRLLKFSLVSLQNKQVVVTQGLVKSKCILNIQNMFENEPNTVFD